MRYKSLKSWTSNRQFPTHEHLLLIETVLWAKWWHNARERLCSFYHAGFHLTIDVAAQFPRSQSSRLWDLGSAPVMRVSHQDPRRRPLKALSGGRVASLQSGHYRPSSATVACSTAYLCPWKWWPFWVQTVTEFILTVRFVFWTVSIM